MAVDYVHRLVVSGPAADVRGFRRSLARTVNRPKVGRVLAWRERIPLSFAAMYARCPQLAQVNADRPYDPYDQSVWRTRPLADGRAELRYQLHTRNIEMREYLVPVSRHFARLALVLVTFCLDDGSMVTYLIGNGRSRQHTIPQKRHDWHWGQAGQRFKLAGDALYDNERARSVAEAGLLEEALGHWDRTLVAARKHALRSRSGRAIARGRSAGTKPREWWDRPRVRDLEFERELTMHELGRSLAEQRRKAR